MITTRALYIASVDAERLVAKSAFFAFKGFRYAICGSVWHAKIPEMSNNQLIGSPRRRKKLRIPKFDPFGDYRQHIPQAISARMIVRSISSGVDLEERQQAVLQRYNVLMEDDVDFAAKRASQERRAKEMEEKEKKLEEVVDYWIEETKKPEYAQNITKQMHVLKRRKNSKPAPKKKTKVGAMVQNDEAGTHEERLDPLPAYSEPIVWPAYEEHYRHTVEMANEDPRITFLDGTAEPPSAEWLQRMLLNFPENLIRIQSEPIKTEEAVEFVSSSSCGATSVFIGTTRNTFHGKRVVKLSYECYEPWLIKSSRSFVLTLGNDFLRLKGSP
ncbi:hypothetical protein L596_007372 [Steinernema carpocapsae]|uniref:Uncharacterized protein n=1 Tax=Steinernema carpocapsae TaxID=34508 RepID=A0A4U5P9S0_STECR|nr:hypothetical protein L596_007372 [Steinernema carpocapsae]